MTFRSLLKIVRKGAYPFSNYRATSQTRFILRLYSFVSHKYTSLVEMSILFAMSHYASEFENKRKILLFWHKRLKTVKCVISDVILLE